MEVRGKVALVTGAGAGIGRAVALRLAREGATVVVADVDEGRGVVREIRSEGGKAAFVPVDLGFEADVSRMVSFAEDEFGGLDVLVNNAGGVSEPYFPDGEPEHWGRAVDLNLRGTMLGIHFGVRARGEAPSSTSRRWAGSVSDPTTSPSTARPRPGSCASPPH